MAEPEYSKWLSAIGPALGALFQITKGNTKAAIAALESAYDRAEDEQKDEMARKRGSTRAAELAMAAGQVVKMRLLTRLRDRLEPDVYRLVEEAAHEEDDTKPSVPAPRPR